MTPNEDDLEYAVCGSFPTATDLGVVEHNQILNPQFSHDDLTNQQLSNQQTTNSQFLHDELTNQQITNQPITNQPITNQPITNQPMTNQPITNLQFLNQPITNHQISNQQTTNPQFLRDEITNHQITNHQITNPQFLRDEITNHQITNPQISNHQFSHYQIPDCQTTKLQTTKQRHHLHTPCDTTHSPNLSHSHRPLKPQKPGSSKDQLERYFTRESILRWIVRAIHKADLAPRAPDELLVDFSAGTNRFAMLMREEQPQLVNCSFDLVPHTGVTAQDWLTVHRLPHSRFCVGLNPPFGYQSALIRRFIRHALSLGPPRVIYLICPAILRPAIPGYTLALAVDLPLRAFITPHGALFPYPTRFCIFSRHHSQWNEPYTVPPERDILPSYSAHEKYLSSPSIRHREAVTDSDNPTSLSTQDMSTSAVLSMPFQSEATTNHSQFASHSMLSSHEEGSFFPTTAAQQKDDADVEAELDIMESLDRFSVTRRFPFRSDPKARLAIRRVGVNYARHVYLRCIDGEIQYYDGNTKEWQRHIQLDSMVHAVDGEGFQIVYFEHPVPPDDWLRQMAAYITSTRRSQDRHKMPPSTTEAHTRRVIRAFLQQKHACPDTDPSHAIDPRILHLIKDLRIMPFDLPFELDLALDRSVLYTESPTQPSQGIFCDNESVRGVMGDSSLDVGMQPPENRYSRVIEQEHKSETQATTTKQLDQSTNGAYAHPPTFPLNERATKRQYPKQQSAASSKSKPNTDSTSPAKLSKRFSSSSSSSSIPSPMWSEFQTRPVQHTVSEMHNTFIPFSTLGSPSFKFQQFVLSPLPYHIPSPTESSKLPDLLPTARFHPSDFRSLPSLHSFIPQVSHPPTFPSWYAQHTHRFVPFQRGFQHHSTVQHHRLWSDAQLQNMLPHFSNPCRDETQPHNQQSDSP